MKTFTTYTFAITLCAYAFLSCTKEKQGVVDISLNAPRLLTASIQPPAVNLDTDTINVVPLGSGNFQINTSVNVQAIDSDGAQDIASLSFVIYPPTSPEPAASGTLSMSSFSGDTAFYSRSLSFVSNRTQPGFHTIEFSIRDDASLLSNVLRLTINVTRNNSRPQISNLSAPDTVRRPNSGSRPVFLAISAADSDGLGDLASVFFKSVNSSDPNFEFPLYDNGDLSTHGDSVAGDARFSTIVYIFSTFPLGTREFRFWARDNVGALSDSLGRFITVIPE